jgi:hypothetical protein
MEASGTESTEEETEKAEGSKGETDADRKNGKPEGDGDTSGKAEKSDGKDESESKGTSEKSESKGKSEKSDEKKKTKRPYLQPKRITGAELAGMVAAAIFVLSLFLPPWYGTSSTNPNSSLGLVGGAKADHGATATAFQTFPILRWVLLAAAIAPFVLAWIVMRQHKLEWKPGEITMVVGIGAFVLVLCNGVILGRPGDSVEISLQWGYPIALLACLGMAVSGFLRQAKHADAKKPPGVM